MPSLHSSSSDLTLIAINGFLGRTSDWGLIRDLLPSGRKLHTIDLLDESMFRNFDEWARRTADQIATQLPTETKKVLLGYSMGGRLALHLLLQVPELFHAAMIVSANPGLSSDEERLTRTKADEIWATKFGHDQWDTVMAEWNAQPTLAPPKNPDADTIVLDRRESDFNRDSLAQILRTWSLGAQRDLRADIARLTLPIQFVTGKDDAKFTALTQVLAAEPAAGLRSHVIVENAGHRVPWDAPTQFRTSLAKFVSRW